jgi:hypothetical protein
MLKFKKSPLIWRMSGHKVIMAYVKFSCRVTSNTDNAAASEQRQVS